MIAHNARSINYHCLFDFYSFLSFGLSTLHNKQLVVNTFSVAITLFSSKSCQLLSVIFLISFLHQLFI